MASPQLENGYTRIANELLERLAGAYLSPNEWQVLLCVIRLSYGYRTKTAHITGAKVARMTGMLKQNVYRVFERLTTKNMIIRERKRVGLQKDWERWSSHAQKESEVITSEAKDGTSEQKESVQIPEGIRGDSFLNVLKKSYKEKGRRSAPSSPEENNQVRQVFVALKESRGWNTSKRAAEAKAVRWMITQGYTPTQILACHDHLKTQPFWREKSLYMMSVQKEIGEWRKNRQVSQQDNEWRVR
jgi:phage replication O-like protein O